MIERPYIWFGPRSGRWHAEKRRVNWDDTHAVERIMLDDLIATKPTLAEAMDAAVEYVNAHHAWTPPLHTREDSCP